MTMDQATVTDQAPAVDHARAVDLAVVHQAVDVDRQTLYRRQALEKLEQQKKGRRVSAMDARPGARAAHDAHRAQY